MAFNAGGAHCLPQVRHDDNHVLGARVVLGDGQVVELGQRSLEHCGPDAIGLFVGSEGLMGIATQVTLRLVPRPKPFIRSWLAIPVLKKREMPFRGLSKLGFCPEPWRSWIAPP